MDTAHLPEIWELSVFLGEMRDDLLYDPFYSLEKREEIGTF